MSRRPEIIPPSISVSMHDAANTGEGRLPEICEECEMEPGTCGYDMEDCEHAAEEAAAEDSWEARRDAYD